jgi:dTDP-4-dehydrorhamnose reductase
MKILVTGSKGLLGRTLAPLLMQQHYEVVGIDVQEADITREDQIVPLIVKTGPELIIHGAALTDLDWCEDHPAETERVNADGTRHVAQACQQLGCELLYISTDYVFGGPPVLEPHPENDPVQPESAYAWSKYHGEEHVRALVSRYYIARTAGLYGTEGKNFVLAILNKAKKDGKLRVINDQVGNRTYIAHLAAGLSRLITTHAYGTYHVANEGACSWYEFAKDIIRMAGLADTTTITPISSAEYPSKVKRPAYSALSLLAYEKATGQKMPHYREALKELLASLQSRSQV